MLLPTYSFCGFSCGRFSSGSIFPFSHLTSACFSCPMKPQVWEALALCLMKWEWIGAHQPWSSRTKSHLLWAASADWYSESWAPALHMLPGPPSWLLSSWQLLMCVTARNVSTSQENLGRVGLKEREPGVWYGFMFILRARARNAVGEGMCFRNSAEFVLYHKLYHLLLSVWYPGTTSLRQYSRSPFIFL